MKRLAFLMLAAAVCILWAGTLLSETIVVKRVSGELDGEWGDDSPPPDTRYVYIVDGPSWIADGSSLTIHGNVTVQILSAPPITVFGHLVTAASQDSPIVIEAVASAEGFRFEGTADYGDTLQHVTVSPDSFPRIVVTSKGRALYVEDCELWASWADIRAYDAPVEVLHCEVYKRGGGEAAISLVGTEGSRITQSRIDVQFPQMLTEFPTTHGVYVNDIRDAQISDNTIEIRGPGFTTGICAESISHSLTIENNFVYCQSDNLVPRGISLKHAVYCTISACTVTVDSRSPAQTALWVYGWTVAEVMNSYLYLGGAGLGELVHQEGGASVILEGRQVQQTLPRAPNRDETPEPAPPQIGEPFPNPFNMETIIPLELSSASFIEVVIRNSLGREMQRISYGVLGEGEHPLRLSAQSWASGVYFVSVIADQKLAAVRRMILVK
jgi:hypothetical protein